MSEKHVNGITIGIEHILPTSRASNNKKREIKKVGGYYVFASKHQRIRHQCEICNNDLVLMIYSQDKLTKEFWLFILGTILTIITVVLSFQYFRFGAIIPLFIGMWITSKLIGPSAEIISETNQTHNGKKGQKYMHSLTYKKIDP